MFDNIFKNTAITLFSDTQVASFQISYTNLTLSFIGLLSDQSPLQNLPDSVYVEMVTFGKGFQSPGKQFSLLSVFFQHVGFYVFFNPKTNKNHYHGEFSLPERFLNTKPVVSIKPIIKEKK